MTEKFTGLLNQQQYFQQIPPDQNFWNIQKLFLHTISKLLTLEKKTTISPKKFQENHFIRIAA